MKKHIEILSNPQSPDPKTIHFNYNLFDNLSPNLKPQTLKFKTKHKFISLLFTLALNY